MNIHSYGAVLTGVIVADAVGVLVDEKLVVAEELIESESSAYGL